MRLNLLILVLLGVAGYALTLYFDHSKAPPDASPAQIRAVMDKTVPAFSFTDLQGKDHSIEDFAGKIIILNFWATWCAPCVKEFPLLVKAAVDNPDRIAVIALSSDIKQEAVPAFLEKHKIEPPENFYIGLDEQHITEKVFETYRLPETFILDNTLVLRHKLIGADWSEEDLQKTLSALQ